MAPLNRTYQNPEPVVLTDTDNKQYQAHVDADGNLAVQAARKTLLTACGTAAGSGNNTLVNAPTAGMSHYVSAFVIQNESATATTMYLSDGTTAVWRCLGQNQGDGLAISFPPGREWKVGDGKAVVLNLSGANSCGYAVSYYTAAA